MRAFEISLVLTLLAAAAIAQQPAEQPTAQTMKSYISSADVEALIAQAMSERKEGQAIVSKRLVQVAENRMGLEYRAGVGPAALHEREDEVFYVIDGAATMVTGGKLVKERRSRAEQLQGEGIEGGTSRSIAKGDVILVPVNTPHWFSAIDGRLVVMSLHMRRPDTSTR